MRVSLVFLFLLIPAWASLLSIEEIQERLNKAYTSEEKHIEEERLKFTNLILPILEKAIVEGKISVLFQSTSHPPYEECKEGKYEDIRPDTFCPWWNKHFNMTICTFTTNSGCPVGIRFKGK